MNFHSNPNMDEFAELESKFLSLEGRSYVSHLGSSYTGYGITQLDSNMPKEQALGVFKIEIARNEEGKFFEQEVEDWQHITKDEFKQLETLAKSVGLLDEFSTLVSDLLETGDSLCNPSIFSEISSIGDIKLKDGLSVQEVLGILKFENDILLCC